MSVSLNVWAIDLSYLGKMHGAARDPRADSIREYVARALSQADLDRRFVDEIASGRLPRAVEALDAIMAGAYPAEASGVMYAYVCEVIVGVWGHAQPCNALAPCGTELPDQVDAALEARGITAFRLSTFTTGTLPLPIPRCDDFPGFGHMTNAQCRDAFDQLGKARFDGENEHVRAAIDDARGWLRAASRRKTTGLVGFFR